MTAKWMRLERGSLLDRILASSVAVILVVIALGDPFPPAARGAAPSEPKNLAAYFVSWHVVARGSVRTQFSNANGWREDPTTEISEMTGSAIVRYVFRNGIPSYFDTRFLTVKVRQNKDHWEFDHFYNDNCISHDSHTIADTGSYSGLNDPNLRVLADVKEYRNGVITEFYRPFGPLRAMHFLQHTQNEGCTASYASDMQTGLDALQADDPDLSVDPKNPSSFYLNKKFSSTKLGLANLFPTMEVEWTAHAYLMGKCAEHAAPIPADDPVIQNEDVHIDADDTEVTPDGKTKLHIKVTCDQVPIEGAEVDLSIKPQKSSGHHDHDNQRPGGKLDGHELTDPNQKYTVKTDAKGSATAVFEPPGKTPASRNVGIAGLYDVKATPSSPRFKDRTDTVALTVKFNNLQSLVLDPNAHYEVCARSAQGCQPPKPGQKPVSGVSAGVGFRGTTAHMDGEWGTEGTLHAFASLGSDLDTFQEQNNESLQRCGKPAWPIRKLSLNDIALEDGGLFDANSTWAIPHQTHSRGQGGDVNRFTGDPLVIDCNGSKVNLDDLLMFSMIELGNDYGHWDTEMNGPLHRLHLHVQD